MTRTILNFTAICDKAGRPNNQDNFWICPDLSSYAATGTVTIGSSSTEVALTEKGALLVVADGMGGMSAGEVASQIVIDSVKRTFSDLKSVSLSNSNAIKSFIKQAIIDADKEMKKHAESHPETRGMGSTIVLVWILDKTVYVGWCGDSRAYCYNAQNGLVRLTHDHSYVQELVDNDKLSEEDAFDHPDSNIITRSLGDSGEKANPDVKEYPLHTGDTFLLCSDGLCGLLRDSEIENIMAQNSSIGNCLNALWKQGSSIGWTDNTTIELAKVLEGGIKPTAIPVGYEAYKKKSNSISQTSTGIDKEIENNKSSIKRVGIVAAIAFVVGLIVGGFITKTFFPAYPADVEGEIKSLKFENDSLRMVISQSGNNLSSNNGNDEQLEAERRAKAEAEAKAAREKKAKEEAEAEIEKERKEKEVAERKAHQERAAREEPERKVAEVKAQAEEEARRAQEEQNQLTEIQLISREYKDLIRRTQQDFNKLRRVYSSIVRQDRLFSPKEVTDVKRMLKNMNNNLTSIENNDSYEYLDSNTKGIIKKLREGTKKIETDFKELSGNSQGNVTQTHLPNQNIETSQI